MIELQSVRLEGCAHHVDTLFEFGTSPVVTVSGINKDRKPWSSNGAGKSALFYALCTVLQDHPLQVSRKVLKQGIITVCFRNDCDYKVVYDGGYTIYRDGEDLNLRTKALAKEMLAEIFPIPTARFYTTFYINSLLFNPFLNATDSQRLTAFEDIFPLGSYAQLQKPMLAKVRELKKKAVRYETLEEQKVDLVKPSVVSYSKELRDKEARLASMEAGYQEHRIADNKYSSLSEAAKKLVPLSKADYDTVIADHEAYAQQVGEYKAKAAAYKKYIKYKGSKPVPKKVIAALEDEIEGLQDCVYDAKRVYDDNMVAERKLKSMECPETTTHTTDDDIHDALSKYKAAREALTELSKVTGGICPTCMSKLSKATLNTLRDNLRRDVSSYSKSYKRLKARKAKETAWESYKELRGSIKPTDYIELDSQLSELEDKLQEYNSRVVVEYVPRPTKPIKPSTLLSVYREAYGVSKPKDFDMEGYKSLRSEVAALRRKKGKQDTEIALYKRERAAQKSLRVELKELQNELEDLPCYVALADAYSNTGIKIHTLRSLAAACSAKLNLYRHLLFAEDFKFEIIINPSSLQVVVTRPSGLVSDVRMLSGAERRQFACLMYLSILSITPSDSRVDTVIFDEIESGMDESSKSLFVNDFLPYLAKQVNVVVVSPTDMGVGENLTVVRENGKAFLKKGL